MEKALKENEPLENTYREIREICGSTSLKFMVDKILTKETNYNESMAQINEIQEQIDVYNKDIEELEIKLKKLKNEVIFKQNSEKTISTLPTKIIQEDENKLIKEEEKLIREEQILKEKLAQINLTYRKIMENIEYFVNEQLKNQAINTDEKIVKKNYNYDETNENFYQQPTAPGQSTNFDPQSTSNNFNITKTTLMNKPLIMNTTSSDNGFIKNKKKYFSRGNTPKLNIFDDIRIPSENLSAKDDSVKAPSENQHLNKNKIMPVFSNEEDSLFDDLSNLDEIIRNYNDYLIWLNKKFDKFFLCYNKDQFKAVMAEKGIMMQENTEGQKGKTQNVEVGARTMKKKKTRRFDNFGHTNKMHIDANNANKENKENKESTKFDDTEVEFDEDDLPVETNEEGELGRIRKKGQKATDIFQRFLEEQENKTNEYIHERELRKKRVVPNN